VHSRQSAAACSAITLVRQLSACGFLLFLFVVQSTVDSTSCLLDDLLYSSCVLRDRGSVAMIGAKLKTMLRHSCH
jgi:hypothetical protein